MICTTIQNRDIDGIFDILDNPAVEMAEIRLDSCDLSQDEIDELFTDSDTPLVATCRISDQVPASVAEAKLIKAIQAGAAYVDVELEAPAMMSKRIRREAHECGTTLIRSFHDYSGTDSSIALRAIVEKCEHLGAEVVKIVTTARTEADCARVMALYNDFEPARLIAFCMGDEGRQTRLDCLRKGAPFSYAAISPAEAAAPGQWTAYEMMDAVYGDAKYMAGDILPMPASKSFAQRAIIAAALSAGTSVLHGYSPCGDSESALAVARALGAEVSSARKKGMQTLTIKGIGAKIGCLPLETLHTGESGFLTRLMIPLLSQLCNGPVQITGEKTLLQRPLKGAPEILQSFGVRLSGEMVPLRIDGRLIPGEVEISGQNGSQVISGLLAALPLCKQDTVLYINNPKSIPYLFMTVDVLKQFGIRIDSEMEGGDEFIETHDWDLCDRIVFCIKGGQRYKAAEMDIEADWSSAANFLVAGAVFGKASLSGLDTSSLQADISILDILTQAGASLSEDEDGEALHVQKAPLTAFEVDAANCPDLFPILAVLAAFCQGTSKIAGVGRLANKESDRGKAIVEMLQQMGVVASVKGDKMCIQGHSLAQRMLCGMLLKGGSYTSHGDHRMVMALKVASLGADGPIEIDDVKCVAKSFPTFFKTFDKL
ncbi:MAG: 3-phosphoshikimate 1-carboxyvinyltransferase [Bacteroidales bacterium]|nr:3-phosphoshikimate 1-carboxyvinyltransferase [Bacteroidales bacterium]